MSEENLHRNVKVSGWGSLFTDMSTEMILPVLPAFLVGVLKAPPGAVGLIEGVAESTASLFKYISGYISDKIRKRKLLVVLGYSFSAFVKPLLYFATSWTFVLAIRFLDRVGKGIRTSPRDALIADSSGKKKGKPFGFQRFMDTLGAVFGSTIALLILRTNTNPTSGYRTIFLLSFIPALAAVIILAVGLKEIPILTSTACQSQDKEIPPREEKFSRKFRLFLVTSFLFTLSNFSYAFYLIRARALGNPDWMLPLFYLINTVFYALVSYPSGMLCDKIGGRNVLAFGYLAYSITALLFGLVKTLWFPFIGFVLYGLFQGVVETSARVVVSDFSRSETRGRAYGSYHTIVGFGSLPSSFMAGIIWQTMGGKNAFFVGSGLSFISFVSLCIVFKKEG